MNSSQALSRFYLFFAAGDAIGKATEFMVPSEIDATIGHIDGLLDKSLSRNHGDLESWQVTDDTEQNLWLLRRYLKDGKVTIQNTVDALVDWINTTGAVEKKYIGPSSYAALKSIQEGRDPMETGLFGTTCGGIMRCPAAVFASMILGQDLDECIYYALLPTHNNSVALESAFAYGYALKAAIEGASLDDVLDSAAKGCAVGKAKAVWESASANLADRLGYIRGLGLEKWSDAELKKFMYGVLGTGLPSYEVSASVFATVLHTSDPVRAIMIDAEAGGDTDTIAALAGGLVSMLNTSVQLPERIAAPLLEHNDLEVAG